MSELIREYSTKLKTFQYMAFIVLVFSFAYVLSEFNPSDPESLSSSISMGILGLILSGFLFYFGSKTRIIKLYDDKIEYIKGKTEFSSDWNDIVLAKSFKEQNRNTENMILMTENEQILDISTAFFDKKKLIECYNEIVEINKNRENFTIEDDRNWLIS